MLDRQAYQITRQTSLGGGSLWIGLLVGVLLAGIGAMLLLLPPLQLTVLARYLAGLVGIAELALLVKAVGIVRYRRRVAQLSKRYPHAPWRCDYPWDPSGIDAPLDRRLRTWGWRSLVSGAILLPVQAVFVHEAGPIVFLAFASADLLFLWMLWHTGRQFLAYRKYGSYRLRFARFPFAPGETLELSLSAPQLVTCKATLRFVEERYWKPPHTRRPPRPAAYERYAQTQAIDPPRGMPQVSLRFELPDEPGWVTRLTADPNVQYWELQIQSACPGIDLDITFPLPVYRVAERARSGARAHGRLDSRHA